MEYGTYKPLINGNPIPMADLMKQKVKHAVFIFTGQGAQYHGMGRDLYISDPCFREVMDELDRIAVQRLSRSVIEILFNSPKERVFNRTLYTHPSLFMVQYALAASLIKQGLAPALLLGSSLGEYLALSVSGALDPKAVLSLLIDHAQDVEAHCSPGGMMGIMTDPGLYHQAPELRDHTSLACISSPYHFIISGERAGLEKAARFLRSEKVTATHLPIRFGFHSPNIDPAQKRWEKQMPLDATPKLPGIKTISCLTGRVVDQVTMNHLIRIPRDPILFPQAVDVLAGEIRGLEDQGNQVAILDLGPGGFTSALMRQQGKIRRAAKVYRVMTAFGNEMRNLEKLKQEMIS